MTATADRRPLDAAALTARLTAGPDAPWRAVTVAAATGSTNADLLAELAAAPDPDALVGHVRLADEQTGGRGRHGRSFAGAPNAQIPISMVLDLSGIEPAGLGWLPLVAGVAVVETLRATAGVDAALKWPNDVLLRGTGGGKVAGILAEVFRGGAEPIVVLGIGINAAQRADELPVDTATSLALAGAGTTDRTEIAAALAERIAARVGAWRRAGGVTGELLAAYRGHCSTIGVPVRAVLPGDAELRGEAIDVDDQGRLLIEVAEAIGRAGAEPGAVTAVAAGDVTHLRRTDGGR